MRRILWFRRDLRAEDNRLLSLDGNVLPIFIFDTDILGHHPSDDRRVSFIFEQVLSLKKSLKTRGLDLALFYGKPVDIFRHLIATVRPDEVCASGDYDPYARERDLQVSHMLPFNFLEDTYIFGADEVLKNDGSPYLVYTPFYKRAEALYASHHYDEIKAGKQQLIPFGFNHLHPITQKTNEKLSIAIESIGFKPVLHHVKPVETLLDQFAPKLHDYAKMRDFIAKNGTSNLSVHLRFGTLGIRQLLRWVKERDHERIDTEPFFRQLIFRDFYASLLYHFPELATTNYKYPFKGIENQRYADAFYEGETGVPIVDAGIRELLHTGIIHNRARMICASFFTKQLLLPWQWGEAFFAKHLLDYDAASNILSWQWSAGTGIDPQPYFRIFNPYRQSEKFDSEALYIKRWIPQLGSIPPKKIHDENFLLENTLDGYPKPIVEHKAAIAAAHSYFKSSLTGSPA